MGGLLEKVEKETTELKAELQHLPAPAEPVGKGVAGSGKPQVPEKLRHRLEEEVGDLFFVLVNVARYLSLDPESALRKTNRKFKRRFQWMEDRLNESGRSAGEASIEELEDLWRQAIVQEKAQTRQSDEKGGQGKPA